MPKQTNKNISKKKNKKIIICSAVVDLNKKPSQKEIDAEINYLNNL